MNNIDRYIQYTVSGYRYAPESFKAYKVILDQSGRGNHSYMELKLTQQQRCEIGNTFISQGKKAACDLAKRYDRETQKKPRLFVTYGFLDARDPSRYHYTRQLYCKPDAPLKNRYSIYKEFKDYLDSGDEVSVSECTLDMDFRPVNVKKEAVRYRVNADLSKPVCVHLRAA